MKKSDGSTWKIEHQCPQCGAPVTLDETDHLLACGYCRVRLWLQVRGGLFSYCLTPGKIPPEKLWFIPYWRFKGLGYSCTEDEVRHRFVDTSLCGLSSPLFPRSLGFRPQVLRLKFASAMTSGTFVKPTVIPSALKERFLPPDSERAGPLAGRNRGRKTFIGETCSLVHTPVYERNGAIWDAILHRPLGSGSPLEDGELSLEARTPRPPAFVPALCPHCGWGLEGSTQSAVMLCRNCHTAWSLSQGGIKNVPFFIPAQRERDHHLLPFWRMKFSFTGIQLNSLEDLARLANTRISHEAAAETPELFLWVPAFKLPPRLFLRAARRLTISPPTGLREADIPSNALHSATLPLAEAAESVKILLASMAMPRRRFVERMDTVSATLEAAVLSFVPFSPQTHDFVQPGLQLSIPRRALSLGRLM